MPNYEEMTMPELYQAWVNNWKVVRTSIQEIIGDMPMPDPREVARTLIEMPEDVWTSIFESEYATGEMRKTMDLQKLIADVQLENHAIVAAALSRSGK